MSLNQLHIINDHITQQFDPEHSFEDQLKNIKHLDITRRHLAELLKFEWDDNHEISYNNLFQDFQTNSNYYNYDGSQFLDEEERESLFGPESDEDSGSEYQPSEIESKDDDDEDI